MICGNPLTRGGKKAITICVRSVRKKYASVNVRAKARLQMIAKIETAPTIADKIALLDSIVRRHREALEILNDLRISLIIEDAKQKQGKRNDT